MFHFAAATLQDPVSRFRHKLLVEDQGANFRALLGGALFAALAMLLLGNPARAGSFDEIAQQVCTWAPTVSAIGAALAFIVFVAGVAMVAVGSRDGFGRTIWAVLGAVALMSIGALFTSLTGGDCGQGDGG